MPNMMMKKELTATKNNPIKWFVDVLIKHPEMILFVFMIITVLVMILDI
ncbi:hypothetical protein [[Eubacterium] cellulosolvens]